MRASRSIPNLGVFALLAVLGVFACEGGGVGPSNTRFGQVGEVRVHLTTPLGAGGVGSLEQVVTWESSGPWRIIERISYLDRFGDENVQQPRLDIDTYAAAYASFITQINETEGLKLFVEALDEKLQPECGAGRTEILFVVVDDTRGAQRSWARCVNGSLRTLQTSGAGPDAAAGRIAQAALLVRNFTVGSDFQSTFLGSVPFATLDRGDESGASLAQPMVFQTDEGWPEFWSQHRGPNSSAPSVDFERDQVIVGAAGPRFEAGDSVEVRRVLQLDGGSVTEIAQRGPGDFCSPAAKTHTPFHIVVSPKTAIPMTFQTLAVERVPCG
jgi:hypothetical protein